MAISFLTLHPVTHGPGQTLIGQVDTLSVILVVTLVVAVVTLLCLPEP